MANVVGLRAAVRRGELTDGKRVRYPESHYLDFLIDGKPLRDLLDITGDFTTGLHRPWLDMLDEELDHLCGRCPDPELPAGRIALLRCGECGDIGCGLLTARLGIDVDHITWSDFAWEDDADWGVECDDPPGWDEYRALSFVFDRQAYLGTLSCARATVAALPHHLPEHRSRGFRWPWP